MSEGFSDPVFAGQGALVRAQVMSPNFNLANPPLSPAQSWALLKTGLAYIFGLVLSGGTITGPDYILDPTGFYFYSGTPAAGNLITAISTAATDPLGNDLSPGDGSALGTFLTLGGTPPGGTPSYLQLVPGSPKAFIGIGTGDPAEASPGKITSTVLGAGGTRAIDTALTAPRVTGQAAGANAQLLLESASPDLTAPPDLVLSASDGTVTSSISITPAGVIINVPAAGAITLENGPILDKHGDQLLGVQADATSFPLVNPVAATAITNAWPIPANDGRAGTTYMIEVPLSGVWQASGALNLEFSLNGAPTNLVPVAAALAAAGHNYGGVLRLYLQVLTAGAAGTCNIWADGGITDTSVARAGATSAVLSGFNLAHALNTTIANTLAVSAVFSVSNAAQTITGQGSTFTRSGP